MDQTTQPARPKPVGRATAVAACLFVLALVAGMKVQQHREARPAPDPASFPIPATSPEAKLAAIQLGRPQLWRGSTVKRLQSLLDLLAADCPRDTRQGLADLAVRSLGQLRARGVAATPTQVLGGVAGLEDQGRGFRCSPYFVRYVGLRASGQLAP